MKVVKNIFLLWRETWKRKKSMVLLFCLRLVLESLFPFVTVVFPAVILNELVNGKNMEKIAIYILCMAATYLLVQNLLHIVHFFMITADMRIGNSFGNECSYKQMMADYEYCENEKALNMISQFYFFVQPSTFLQTIGGLLSAFLQVLISVFILIFLDLPVLIMIMAFLLIQNILLVRKKKLEYQQNANKAGYIRKFEYFGQVLSEYRYAKEVRAYQMTDWIVKEYHDILNKYSLSLRKFLSKQTPLSFGLLFFDVLQMGMFYSYGALRVIVDDMVIGNFNMLITIAVQLQNSVMQFLSSVNDVIQLSQYIDIYKEYSILLDTTNQVSGKVHLESTDSNISLEFRNVSFSYPGTELKVLNNVSFTVQSGMHIAIVGPNGSGKTTVVKLLCRLYRPTEGIILLNGKDIFEYDLEDYVRNISVLLQDYKIMSFSVLENITLNQVIEEDKVWRCLDKSGVGNRIRSMEQKLDTFLYKDFSPNGVELSGGESQKIALARELYKKGNLLIFDEPTASLDPMAEYEFYSKLKELADEKTCIYISHRLYSVKFSDYIFVFQEGNLVEKGTHQELIKQNGLYKEMFEKQACLYRGDKRYEDFEYQA